ncbi:hypothetical protein BFL38_11845 [Brachyspira hampsonii]|uniref:Uncharacterized protein n=1 Tax=Brachyspira hampsonii TaxID=1287055 RepID=A0A1E5NIW6_9SPIR|nr:hypothetical protein [Brachyspira hampsonii]OEJ16129.1 hypothetical protein BFL38_11845 [Brachyspira hampsonii]
MSLNIKKNLLITNINVNSVDSLVADRIVNSNNIENLSSDPHKILKTINSILNMMKSIKVPNGEELDKLLKTKNNKDNDYIKENLPKMVNKFSEENKQKLLREYAKK